MNCLTKNKNRVEFWTSYGDSGRKMLYALQGTSMVPRPKEMIEIKGSNYAVLFVSWNLDNPEDYMNACLTACVMLEELRD